jgi:hypothetical protein
MIVFKTYQVELTIDSDAKFIVFFKFMGFGIIQLGMSVDLKMKNVEIFFPFGFIHFGLESKYSVAKYSTQTRKDLQ